MAQAGPKGCPNFTVPELTLCTCLRQQRNFRKPCRRQNIITFNPINQINPSLYWLFILYFLKSFNPVQDKSCFEETNHRGA